MKLKEYMYYAVATTPIKIVDANVDKSRMWFNKSTAFADKTLIPKEVLDLEVRKFDGDLYFPGEFCSEDEAEFYDCYYDDWWGCVIFYVEGFQEVKDKLKLGEVVK